MVIEVDINHAPFLRDKEIELVINGKRKSFTILAHYSDKKKAVVFHIPPSFPKEAVKVIFGYYSERNGRF